MGDSGGDVEDIRTIKDVERKIKDAESSIIWHKDCISWKERELKMWQNVLKEKKGG